MLKELKEAIEKEFPEAKLRIAKLSFLNEDKTTDDAICIKYKGIEFCFNFDRQKSVKELYNKSRPEQPLTQEFIDRVVNNAIYIFRTSQYAVDYNV